MYLLGIDIGTTNTKLVLFKMKNFDVIQKYRFPTEKINKREGTDFDIDKIWENIKFHIKDMCNKVKFDNEILGISIASVGESGVLLNDENEVIGPAITWFDKRGQEYIKNLVDELSFEKIYKITGLPPHSNYSVGKIKWIIEKNHNKNPNKLTWLSLANYFAFKFTGECFSEYSLASRTLAFDLNKRDWSGPILSKLNIKKSLFPSFKKSGEIIGLISGDLQKELNLPKNTLVSVAGHDHMVGSLITNLNEDEILNSTGTTEGLLYIQKQPNFSAESFNNKLSNGIYVKNDLFSYFGSIPAAGFSVDWLRKLLNIGEEIFLNREMKNVYSLYKSGYFDFKSLLFIPHLRGSGPPIRSTNSKSLIYGFNEHTSKSDFIFALFLGMCFELKNLLNVIKELTNTDPKVIKVIGSATRNDFWLQLKSDVLGCQIIAYDVEEPVAMGAAISMAEANKWIEDTVDVVDSSNIKLFHPNNERNTIFNDMFNNQYKPFLEFKHEFEI